MFIEILFSFAIRQYIKYIFFCKSFENSNNAYFSKLENKPDQFRQYPHSVFINIYSQGDAIEWNVT